mgnify:CR=1 FL=1
MNATQSATVDEAQAKPEEGVATKEDDARKVVKKNMYWAMGIGVIPVPLVDLIGIIGFQAKALRELSRLYGIPFSEHTVKNILATLISGLGSVYLGQALARSSIKMIPVIGPLTSLAATPLMAGALTYATGRVFIQHFESGGTFLDFDPKAVREYFKEQYQEGLNVASKMKSEKSS